MVPKYFEISNKSSICALWNVSFFFYDFINEFPLFKKKSVSIKDIYIWRPAAMHAKYNAQTKGNAPTACE